MRLILPLLFATATLMLGCTGSTSPATPPLPGTQSTSADTLLKQGTLGTLEFELDASGRPTVALTDRSGQFPVLSDVVSAKLLNAAYSGEHRLWALEIAITNHTPLTAFGPVATFYDLSGNTIVNADGYFTLDGGGDQIWWPGAGQIKPVVAFNKEEVYRPWVGGSTLVTTILIRWPDGIDDFNGLKAYLDVSYPGPRTEPIVEHPQVHPCVVEGEGGCISAITAVVVDWQAPDAPLPVVALFEADGQAVPVAMVDDGTGLDATSGDHVYTGILPFDPRGTIPYFLVVAGDHEGAHFLNAVAP